MTARTAASAEVPDLEQRRRALQAADPEMYAYVQAIERCRALDVAGELLANAQSAKFAANRVYNAAGAARELAYRLRYPGEAWRAG